MIPPPRYLIYLIAISVAMLVHSSHAHDIPVHRRITQAALLSDSSVYSFLSATGSDAYSRFYYSIPDGGGSAPTPLNLNAREWIEEGVVWEDEEHILSPRSPIGERLGEANGYRFTNHFYTPFPKPAKPITDTNELPPVWYKNIPAAWTIASANNSFRWASNRNQPFSIPGIGARPNIYSWQNARDYQYEALTAASAAACNEGIAKTLFSLGHVIHLIQDLSQPGHVRNDNHALKRYIEFWGRDKLNTLSFP